MRRRMMMQKGIPSILPAGYNQLNFIESTGTQWIDLQYVCADDHTPHRMKLKFQCVSMGGYIFGTNRQAAGAEYIFGLGVDGNEKFFFTRIGTSGSGIRFTSADLGTHDFEYVFQRGVIFDGELITNTIEAASLKSVSSGTKIGVFCRLNGNQNTSGFSKVRIYSLELWGQTEPHRILIPCQRTVDGAIGLFDTVTQQFFGNAGTGEFIGG